MSFSLSLSYKLFKDFMMYDDITTLIFNGMCLCMPVLYNFVLISNKMLRDTKQKNKQKSFGIFIKLRI